MTWHDSDKLTCCILLIENICTVHKLGVNYVLGKSFYFYAYKNGKLQKCQENGSVLVKDLLWFTAL